MKIILDSSLVTLLCHTVKALENPMSGTRTSLPRWMPDGTEAKTAQDYAALLGTTTKIAALAMIEAKIERRMGRH